MAKARAPTPQHGDARSQSTQAVGSSVVGGYTSGNLIGVVDACTRMIFGRQALGLVNWEQGARHKKPFRHWHGVCRLLAAERYRLRPTWRNWWRRHGGPILALGFDYRARVPRRILEQKRDGVTGAKVSHRASPALWRMLGSFSPDRSCVGVHLTNK